MRYTIQSHPYGSIICRPENVLIYFLFSRIRHDLSQLTKAGELETVDCHHKITSYMYHLRVGYISQRLISFFIVSPEGWMLSCFAHFFHSVFSPSGL